MLLIYDCEIIKCIHQEWDKNPKNPKLDYCKGWEDFENMGISVIGTFNTRDNEYIAFIENSLYDEWFDTDNLSVFKDKKYKVKSLYNFQKYLNEATVLVGFNNQKFDDNLIKANGFTIPTTTLNYDLLAESWESMGMSREFIYPTHAGYSLDRFCEVNGLGRKTSSGELAPVDWQKGNYIPVIDYCINDIVLTKKLMSTIMSNNGWIKIPKEKTRLKTIQEKLEEL